MVSVMHLKQSKPVISCCSFVLCIVSRKSLPWRVGFNTPLSTPLESLLLVLSCHSFNITYADCHAVHQTSQPPLHPGRCLLTPQCVLGSGLFLGIFAGRSPSPQALLCKATGNEPFPLLSAHSVFPVPCFPVEFIAIFKGLTFYLLSVLSY